MNHKLDSGAMSVLRPWARSDLRSTQTTPRIAFRTAGESQGLPLFLLHSLAVDQSTWGPTVEVLERSHRVITADSRGHGSSDAAEATPEFWVGDIIAVLDTLEIDRAILVGVSMGGIQAIATAAAAPERIAGIIVADSFAALPEAISNDRIRGLTDYASSHTMTQVASKYVEDTFVASGDQRGPELVRSAMALMYQDDYKAAVKACFGADVTNALNQVRVPALVLWGEHDAKTPLPLSEAIAAGIAHATLKTIPGAAHLSHLDQPERFAAHVSEFAKTLQKG